ncbi:MAG: hypothetical protein AMXMBFR58_18800 [Phycisphaerae bacterium]
MNGTGLPPNRADTGVPPETANPEVEPGAGTEAGALAIVVTDVLHYGLGWGRWEIPGSEFARSGMPEGHVSLSRGVFPSRPSSFAARGFKDSAIVTPFWPPFLLGGFDAAATEPGPSRILHSGAACRIG